MRRQWRWLDSLLREFEPRDNTGQAVLELKKVNETDDEIVFCDARLKTDLSGELSWQLHNKAEDMGSMASKLNRYNHAHTTLANSIHKATFRNELNRIYTLSKTLPHFLHSAGMVICRHIILENTTTNLNDWCENFRPPQYIYQQWQPDETTEKQCKKMVCMINLSIKMQHKTPSRPNTCCCR